MRLLLKIVVGIVVLIVAAAGVVYYLTSDMTEAADEFFAAIEARDFPKAYRYLSEDFRASTSLPELTEFVENSAMLSFQKASWRSRSISGGRAELDGSVTTASGGVVPITLDLVKENGRWFIYSIRRPRAGIFAYGAQRLLSEAEQVALVRDSMARFASAVHAENFTDFHAHVSQLWRREVGVQDFNDVFSPFWGMDLASLNDVSPVFDAVPDIDEHGVLLIEGHYPTSPSSVLFELQYIYEGLSWKLFGINVDIR
jgi:hypothetical protein